MPQSLNSWILALAFILLANTITAACCSNPLPAFEKIYVSPCEVLCTPYGTYYINSQGEQIPVSTVSTDYNGPYVILITRQCTNCGKTFQGRVNSADGTICTF